MFFCFKSSIEHPCNERNAQNDYQQALRGQETLKPMFGTSTHVIFVATCEADSFCEADSSTATPTSATQGATPTPPSVVF